MKATWCDSLLILNHKHFSLSWICNTFENRCQAQYCNRQFVDLFALLNFSNSCISPHKASTSEIQHCRAYCVIVCVWILSINGQDGISDWSSTVSWDLDMKRERDEERFKKKERNPLIVLVFSCVVLFYHTLPPSNVCACVCVCMFVYVCVHQSPTITQQSFPLSQLYHSVSASALPSLATCLFHSHVILLSCHT